MLKIIQKEMKQGEPPLPPCSQAECSSCLMSSSNVGILNIDEKAKFSAKVPSKLEGSEWRSANDFFQAALAKLQTKCSQKASGTVETEIASE